MSDILSTNDSFKKPSFSLKNRLQRMGWSTVSVPLFKATPAKFFMAWRRQLLRVFGAKIGKGVNIYPNVKIWAPWNLEMGDESCLSNNVHCYNMDTVTIGKRVVVSQNCIICCGSHDYNDINHPVITKPITIEDYAWVTMNVFIQPGVTIHRGAVIGAGSIVSKDMPEMMVCAGNPCKPIKKRELNVQERL